MASSGSGYDLSSSTFSPDGRIFQVEYAGKAVEHAGLLVGISCEDGIVLAATKPQSSKMLVAGSGSRLATVAANCGGATTGFAPDGRQVVGRAREEAASYVETYGSTMPPSLLADRVAHYVHYFTLHGALRPFGATTMLAGYDEETSQCELYMVEPNGVAYQYRACAAGAKKQPAKTELEKLELHKTSIKCEEAVKQICKIVYLLQEEGKQDKPFELEMSWISTQTNWKHQGVPKDVLQNAVAWAKEQLEEEEEDDDEEEEEGAAPMEE